ncbi:Leucine Rich repeats (2 copies) [Gemmata sp. SH-PL17]|uniref:TIGR02996 domain-containing protein n=1 Tax=Gemmata sp. SH-PL17 TaxID=1630693 RepID=UPI00078BCE25|nr:TIGR02996 domain-containing protein [Gemmata sp. SH-PL17]AMV29232.1 Leucine Rich repeats (2 copies) [Gemmata sp. SH-PL17]
MTSDERAFLKAICDQPADDTVRLVFADWLEEHGQAARANFIRTQIELVHTPPGTDEDERRRVVLFTRRDAALKAHGAAWLRPFHPYAREDSFVRGFVQKIDVPANTFLQHAESWFECTPLTRVKFTTCRIWDQMCGIYAWWTEPLFASPFLSRLESIDLEGLELNAHDMELLAAHPDLSRLRELVLADNDIRTEGAIALANMPQLRGLESLDVRGNRITDRGARALAQSEYLGQLKELYITKNSIRDRNWAVLESRFGDALH